MESTSLTRAIPTRVNRVAFYKDYGQSNYSNATCQAQPGMTFFLSQFIVNFYTSLHDNILTKKPVISTQSFP